MAIDEVEANVLHLSSHNSFNDLSRYPGGVNPAVGPSQKLPLAMQLEVGVCHLELDVWLTDDNNYVTRHGGFASGSPQRPLKDDLDAVKSWMDANPSEVVLLSFDNFVPNDRKDPNGKTYRFGVLADLFQEVFGESKVTGPNYTDSDFSNNIIGKSRAKLVAQGTRLVVYLTPNDQTPGTSVITSNVEFHPDTYVPQLSEDLYNLDRVYADDLLEGRTRPKHLRGLVRTSTSSPWTVFGIRR